MAPASGKPEREPARKLSPIPFRVTEEERQKIAAAAARVGLTVSAYIRACVLDGAPTMRATKKPSVEAEMLARLLAHVGKIANDTRELVQKAHSSGSKTEAGFLKALAEIREAAKAILITLGKRPGKIE